MTPEERFKITSNDYADLFIPYNGNEANLTRFGNYTSQVINFENAIVYVPYTQIAGRSVNVFGYRSVPLCYGLNSDRSLESSGVQRVRQTSALNLRGQGVLVGVVDTGIDYTNPVFMHEDGTTKIVRLWDQTIDSEDQYPQGTFFGTEYTDEQINQALKSPNPFDVVPSRDEIGHGTMLAGIAAGSQERERSFSGVAPDSDLVVVKLKQAKPILRNFFVIPPDVPCYQENDIIWGVQYLLAVGRLLDRPVAICIGLGTSQGGHSGFGNLGSSLLSVGSFPNVTITVSAGNEGNSRRHYYGEIDPTTGTNTVELNVGENEFGFSMELWGYAPSTYSIDILSPSGEYIPRIAESLRVNRNISFIFEKTQITIDYKIVEIETGDQLILMRFRNPAPGIWRFQVYGRGDIPGSFHIWLPANDFITTGTYFIQPNPFTTVTPPGNTSTPLTVTAYNPDTGTLYPNASRGYTLYNIVKPDLAAPGVNILAPTLDHGFEAVSGTSAAAAHGAGISAMMLEWGVVKGNYPDITGLDVKKFLIRGAQRSPRQQYPNREWGFGSIDIFNTFSVLSTVS